MKVIKHFQDKETHRYYRVGAEYKGDRVEELQKKGFLESDSSLQRGNEEIEPPDFESILDGNVDEVRYRLDGHSQEHLKRLLEIEKNNKNRKTVVKEIESVLL